ncbi:Ankyrin repeat and KH domain-containing protein 1, partial [Durusdinium trenchii]
MRVLQDTLKNLLSGESEVSVDLITEAVYFRSTGRAFFETFRCLGLGRSAVKTAQMPAEQFEGLDSCGVAGEAVARVSTEYFSGLFLWYDYFSCPQLEEKGDACAYAEGSNHLQMAIDSIPVYVSRCDFFMALCPVLSSPDGTETFSDYTWGDRGWCRVEQLVRDLTVNQGSWILVKSAMHQELKVSQLSSSSPGDAWSQAYAAILCRPREAKNDPATQ